MPNTPKRIRLTIDNVGDIRRAAWPVTQGVPFAEGELPCGAPVRVIDDRGRPLPTQHACLATWSRDLKYVKWLLIDFQSDLPRGSTTHLFLEYGDEIDAPPPQLPVVVAEDDKRVRVDTGRLRLDVRKDTADFMSGCAIKTEEGWHDVFRGRPGPHLYIQAMTGRMYRSDTGAPPPIVTIEDHGPLRASVCIKGHHASSEGLRLCPFILRIHAYAGKADLRFFHTFVFDQNPDLLELAQVGMFFPLDLGCDVRMAFGGQDRTHWARRWSEGRLLQSSDIKYKVACDGEPFGSGRKTRGWASLCGKRASAFVAVRDFWQQYPKGYKLTHDGIDVQFWPAGCGDALVYHTPWK